eukprot:447058-Alexandrium_andersonii.AAC.1
MPLSELKNDDKIIRARWLEPRRKDDGSVRVRYVAQEIAYGQKRNDLFAATPTPSRRMLRLIAAKRGYA